MPHVVRWRRVSMFVFFATIAIVAFFAVSRASFRDSKEVSVADPKESHSRYAAELKSEPRADLHPDFLLLEVPFSPQAPFANWAQPWQDACEETSVLMAVSWARGFAISPAFAAEEILKQVAFEERIFGYHRDTNLRDTARIMREFYHYENFELREIEATKGEMQEELRKGNIILAPLAGELLENPYFISPPRYHMAVVIGYDDRSGEFVVNEPGTKHGNRFRYRYENFLMAIHDWTGSAETILDGEKKVLVVRPVNPVRGGSR